MDFENVGHFAPPPVISYVTRRMRCDRYVTINQERTILGCSKYVSELDV